MAANLDSFVYISSLIPAGEVEGGGSTYNGLYEEVPPKRSSLSGWRCTKV